MSCSAQVLRLPVQNPDKLIDQAKNILENTTEIPNIRMTRDDALIEKDEAIGDMAGQYPRGQRPGLQRKRARFSLLPSMSQPTVNLDSTLDYNKGPEEYFLAFERRQNAQKEIAKQTGNTFTSSDQYNVFKVPRSERQGIPGRSKKAKYTHLYSALPSQNNSEGYILSNGGSQKELSQPDLASQETEQDNVKAPQLESTNVASEQAEPSNVATGELELSGSMAKAVKMVNQLTGELLPDGYRDLEGHRAINLLKECFQVKPLHFEKLNLPEMEDVLKLNLNKLMFQSNPPTDGYDVCIANEFMNEYLNLEHGHVDHLKNGRNDLEDTVDDVMPDAEASAEPNQSTDYSPVNTSKSNQNDIDPAVVEDQSLDGRSPECVGIASDQTQEMALEQTQATSLELQTEIITESSARPMTEITKGKSCPRRERKNKNLSRRQSLAGCGLSWDNGVRRSTRIRSRPLEYWRGERFLYGRIHQGLATVIGVKYESPGKDNRKPTMKVKSFVSNKHKHLVDEAALC